MANWSTQLLANVLTLVWATRSEVRLGVSHHYLINAAQQLDGLALQCRNVQAHDLEHTMLLAAVELRAAFKQTVAALTRGGNIAALYQGVEGRAEVLTKLDGVEDAIRTWWLTIGMHCPELTDAPASPEDPANDA
jgi:hypothetical protein